MSLAAFGGSGSYTLNSGLLNLYGLSRGTGATAFNVGAGTIQAGASFATSVPIVSNQLGSNAVFDTNGNAITLNAAFSGLGGLEKIGAGTLTLAVSNSYPRSDVSRCGDPGGRQRQSGLRDRARMP